MTPENEFSRLGDLSPRAITILSRIADVEPGNYLEIVSIQREACHILTAWEDRLDAADDD